MTPTRIARRAVAGLLLGTTAATAQVPAVTTDKAFDVRPKQPNVPVSTPSAGQLAQCRVDPIPNPKAANSPLGYVVRDPAGKPLRQFVSYDNKSFNIVAFYIDGQEAYRETYPLNPAEPHNYRWLGPNGGKWGIDRNRDGLIDEWVVLSPEEASQELFQAVLTRDVRRLQVLMPSDKDFATLKLTPTEAGRLKEKMPGAVKRLTDAADALKLSPKAKWVHLELGLSYTTPADAFGGRDDQVCHRNAVILIEDEGKTHFLQTGELLLVERAWKVVEGPSNGPGGVTATDPTQPTGPVVTEAIRPFVAELDVIDRTQAPNPPTPDALAVYYDRRAGVLEKIVAALPPDKQNDWLRLLIDNLTAAAEGGKADGRSFARLKQWQAALAKDGSQAPLAGYVTFRVLVAENGIELSKAKPADLRGIQDKWRTALEEFVKAYPTAEDAGEAVLRLAMAHEFAGKDGEPKAKGWYEHLTQKYPQHVHAAKAAGAVKRLTSDGQPFDLAGPAIGTGKPFAAAQLAGKPYVVYYWASWSTTLADDAKKLKELVAAYGPKGLELVTVCLDDDAKTAAQAVAGLNLPGTHLHQPGGLDRSPLATAYGVLLAPHTFVVGKDGKVVNRNAQVGMLDDDVKKVTQ